MFSLGKLLSIFWPQILFFLHGGLATQNSFSSHTHLLWGMSFDRNMDFFLDLFTVEIKVLFEPSRLISNFLYALMEVEFFWTCHNGLCNQLRLSVSLSQNFLLNELLDQICP